MFFIGSQFFLSLWVFSGNFGFSIARSEGVSLLIFHGFPVKKGMK
jgi:UPF0716 family protein affecting phage T7 exclusion